MPEYKSQVWRMNVCELTLKREPVPDLWKRLGGLGAVMGSNKQVAASGPAKPTIKK